MTIIANWMVIPELAWYMTIIANWMVIPELA